MTYEEAEVIVKDNLALTTHANALESFPYYIQQLIIAPKFMVEHWETAKVFENYIANDFDNKKALFVMGLLKEDLDVFIMGSSDYKLPDSFVVYKKLSEYLSELANQQRLSQGRT